MHMSLSGWARLWIVWVFLVSACGAPPPSDSADQTSRVMRERGFQTFELGGGRRFSILDSEILSAFNSACSNRPHLQPCDSYANYHFEVVIDEHVNVHFVHRDDMRSEYVPAFACTNTAPGWRCQIEQQ